MLLDMKRIKEWICGVLWCPIAGHRWNFTKVYGRNMQIWRIQAKCNWCGAFERDVRDKSERWPKV